MGKRKAMKPGIQHPDFQHPLKRRAVRNYLAVLSMLCSLVVLPLIVIIEWKADWIDDNGNMIGVIVLVSGAVVGGVWAWVTRKWKS